MNKKLIATLVFFGTLALGAAAGIFVDRALVLPRPHWQSSPAPEGSHRRSDRDYPRDFNLKNFSRQLDLTPVQQDTLDKILDKYRQRFKALSQAMHPRFHAIRDSLNAEIRVTLTTTQQEKFDRMIRSSEKERRQAH